MQTRSRLLPAIMVLGACLARLVHAEVNQVEQVAEDVYFHEGDLGRKGHCNHGWIVFEDYVLVIDGNFPSGAKEVIPKINALTPKPIRFAFNTHHHGDHAYGNQVWADHGATGVAHIGVLEEMRKYEPGRWNDTAKNRPDVAASKLKPPSLLFQQDLIFDDGKRRVELRHFGVAHTRGDGFAWLPKERILFTGDACVNGPYNYVGDGHTEQWIATLEAARKLEPKVICPGHGPLGGPEILDHQIAYFKALRAEVKKVAGKSPAEVKAAISAIKETLRQDDRLALYIGNMFDGQVEKIYVEMGGQGFQARHDPAADHWRDADARRLAQRKRP